MKPLRYQKRKFTTIFVIVTILLLIYYTNLPKNCIIKVKNGAIYKFIKQCDCSRKYLWPPTLLTKSSFKLNSSCSDDGSFNKDNQNVVTFSLYLKNKTDRKITDYYRRGIQINLKRIRQLYPDYTMRIYTDVDLNRGFCEVYCANPDIFWCDIRKTPVLGDQSEMFYATWRFLVLGDPTVNIFLSRDLDSAITAREAAAVKDWLETKKAIHVMRDKFGAHNAPILAGMWGAINPFLSSDAVILRDKIVSMSQSSKNIKTLDQIILNRVIFYAQRNDIVAYDSYHCERWKKITMVKPFPTKRINSESDFVGNVDFGMAKFNLTKCPLECRPAYGKDWDYC